MTGPYLASRCASASSASAGPASSTSRPTTRIRTPGRGARRAGGPPAGQARRALRDRARGRASGRTCSTVEGLDAVSVCVPTFLHAPIAIAALERGLHVLSEKPIALDGAEAAAHGQGRPQGRPRARRRLQPPPARRHPEAQGADRRGPARPPVLRQGVVAAPHRHPHASAAGSRAASSRAAARWSTSASTCSTGRSSSSVTRRSSRSAPRPTTCWPPTASAPAPPGATRARPAPATATTPHFDVEDLASVFMRLADGGTLLVEASWAAHRRDGDEFGITLYGTDGGAELIVDDYAPEGRSAGLHRRRRRGRRHPRARQARPGAQGGHRAVRGQDPRRRLAPIRRRRAPPRSPASWTPATCRPPSSARSGWTEQWTGTASAPI